MSEHEMFIGTILRSTHAADVRDGVRQRRVVVRVEDRYVWVQTARSNDTLTPATRILRSARGKVLGHEVVSHPRRPAVQQEGG